MICPLPTVSVIVPPLLLVFDLFDLLEGVKLATVDAGAARRRHVPLVGRMQIERPERPGATLIGTNRIDRTPAATVFFTGQKDAVFGLFVLFDTVFTADAIEVFFLYFFDAQAQMFGQKLDFFFGDPDVPLLRPRTAIAAAGTLKMQPFSIPFVISLQDSVLSLQVP